MMLPVAILAGGLATRLRPLSDELPKALIEVSGRPFAFHQLELLRRKGVEDVVFCTGYRGEMIEGAIGDGSRWDMRIRYSPDGPTPLGTGGALRRAAPLLGERFFVLYGDTYLDCDYAAVARAADDLGKLALMTVFHNDNQWDRSNVALWEGKIVRYDKRESFPDMHHIDWGLGVLNAEALRQYSVGEPFDLSALYQELLRRGELAAFEVANRFYEIGSAAGIEETERFLSRGTGGRMSYTTQHLREATEIIGRINVDVIEKMVGLIAAVRKKGGRLFFLGVGGSAANCSHAVNDFRKIVGMEAYAPTDNVAELTARTNDDGWPSIFVGWLKVSKLRPDDMLFILSVGGGNVEKNISPNLVAALRYAKEIGAGVVGVVGRDGGYTAEVADACVVIPTVNAQNVTPHTEAFQAIVWHLLVSHPALKMSETKWESTI